MPAASASDQETTSGVHFPPPFIYVAGLAAGLLLKRLLPLPELPRPVSTGLAAVLLVPGFGLLYWSLALFFRKRTSPLPFRPTTRLVISGPYRRTRNPMYLGMLLAYLGIALLFEILWAVALTPAVAALVGRFVIRKEEHYLEGRFGDDYRRYKTTVGRWLGRRE